MEKGGGGREVRVCWVEWGGEREDGGEGKTDQRGRGTVERGRGEGKVR